MEDAHRYFLLNKPRGMVSQFTSSHKVRLLGDLSFTFPTGTHAIGRLDQDSEGLLLLTTNKKVTRLLFLGEEQHERLYLVQMNNMITEEKVQRLRDGVSIRIKTGVSYLTPPCKVERILDPRTVYPGVGEEARAILSSWLTISLTEGKYHQVRKMIAATHHRCRRLVRLSIEQHTLAGIAPGEILEVDESNFFEKLRIRYPGITG